MLKQRLFEPGTSADDIRTTLSGTAASVEQGYVFTRQLTEEELAARRETYANQRIKVTKLAAEASETAKGYKTQIDAIGKEAAQNLSVIRDRFEEVSDTVYIFPDEETGMMGYYDLRGELVYSRRMTPEERAEFVQQPNTLRRAM